MRGSDYTVTTGFGGRGRLRKRSRPMGRITLDVKQVGKRSAGGVIENNIRWVRSLPGDQSVLVPVKEADSALCEASMTSSGQFHAGP